MEVKLEKDVLWIGVPIAKSKVLSPSGKSYGVATTNGNQPVALNVFGSNQVVKIGLNAFIPVQK